MKPDLDKLEEMHKAATPGPWPLTDHQRPDWELADPGLVGGGSVIVGGRTAHGLFCSDAALISTMRNALPWLIEQAREAERLRAKLGRVRDFLKYHANCGGGIVYEINVALEGDCDATD